MRKNNLKKFIVSAGLALGITVAATGLNTGAVTAASTEGIEPLRACDHSYVYVLNGTSVRLTENHPFKNNITGEWQTCTKNRVVEAYVGRCTRCGVYGGQGYTKEYIIHLNQNCPDYGQRFYL